MASKKKTSANPLEKDEGIRYMLLFNDNSLSEMYKTVEGATESMLPSDFEHGGGVYAVLEVKVLKSLILEDQDFKIVEIELDLGEI